MKKTEMYVGLLEGTIQLSDILEGKIPDQFKKKKDSDEDDDDSEEEEGSEEKGKKKKKGDKKKKKNPFEKSDKDDE